MEWPISFYKGTMLPSLSSGPPVQSGDPTKWLRKRSVLYHDFISSVIKMNLWEPNSENKKPQLQNNAGVGFIASRVIRWASDWPRYWRAGTRAACRRWRFPTGPPPNSTRHSPWWTSGTWCSREASSGWAAWCARPPEGKNRNGLINRGSNGQKLEKGS